MKKERFQDITSHYRRLVVGLVGDFSLDRYLEIDPERTETSIETGLAVHNVIRTRSQPGSAGTILSNLVDLGAKAVMPVGFCGKDGEGYELQQAFKAKGSAVPLEHFFPTGARRTFTYCKPLVMHAGRPPEELNRLDSKNWTPTPGEVEERICRSLAVLAGRVDALVVLDQVDQAGTGVITARVLQALREISEEQPGLLIVADSRRGLSGWPSLTYKMNLQELSSMAGCPAPASPEDIGRLAIGVARRNGRTVFVTMAERGMLAATPEGRVEVVGSFPVRGPIDIVGAGDSVTANLTMALAAGADVREALELASAGASIVIHQLGTTGTATPVQMQELLYGSIQLA